MLVLICSDANPRSLHSSKVGQRSSGKASPGSVKTSPDGSGKAAAGGKSTTKPYADAVEKSNRLWERLRSELSEVLGKRDALPPRRAQLVLAEDVEDEHVGGVRLEL